MVGDPLGAILITQIYMTCYRTLIVEAEAREEFKRPTKTRIECGGIHK